MFLITSLSSALDNLPEILFPLNLISPFDNGLILTIARPIVVLPLPDSPTKENVSPL